MRRNFLDLIPSKSERAKTVAVEGGRLGVALARDSLVERFVRRFIKNTPSVYTVKFDDYGSFVWGAIDGKRSAFEIANMLCERFAGDISGTDGTNLVCARLCKFIGILGRGGLVYLKDDAAKLRR
jgi:hypothetical protein